MGLNFRVFPRCRLQGRYSIRVIFRICFLHQHAEKSVVREMFESIAGIARKEGNDILDVQTYHRRKNLTSEDPSQQSYSNV